MSPSFKSSKQEHLSEIKKEFYNHLKQYKEEFKPTKELTTYSTLPLLTSSNYPNISIFQVTNSSIENTQEKQNKFVKKDYSHILQHKARSVVATSQPTHKTQSESIHNELKTIYSSKKPIESEHIFENELKIGSILSSKTAGLLGNSTPLMQIKTHDNISISKHLEKHQSGETKTKEAIIDLYDRGFNDTQIRTLLSLSSFGLKKNKILVPSKWAISACDSILEEYLHSQILKYRVGEEFLAFHHNDKGNEFIICMLPYHFCSEVIENFYNSVSQISVVERDFVTNSNKLQTKEPQCAGGYWATKLAMFEYMIREKKQYACISIRIINNYEIPLGVIFVRECVRSALSNSPIIKTTNKEEFEKYIFKNYLNHFKLYEQSRVLYEVSKFKNLNSWM